MLTGETLNRGQKINIFYEVKTLSPNSDLNVLKRQIEKGVDQTIQNIQSNPSVSNSTTIGVLMVDKDAYMKAYNSDPAYYKALYEKLSKAGGRLNLVEICLKIVRKQLIQLLLK